MQVTFDPTNTVELNYVRALVGDGGPAAATAVAESAPAKPRRRSTRKKKDETPDPQQTSLEEAIAETQTKEPAPAAPAVKEDPALTVRDTFQKFVSKHQAPAALELLEKFGVKRFSNLAPDQYADFINAMNEYK